MRILYIGQLDFGGTCFDRLQAIKRLGHDVVSFDTSRFQSKIRLFKSMQWRFKPRMLLHDLNTSLVKFAKQLETIDLIWIDKGIWIFPESIYEIKKHSNGHVVHYTPDSQFLINRSDLFEKSLNLYDFLITTKSFEVDNYTSKSPAKVILVNQGICLERYQAAKSKTMYQCDIGLISDYKPHYGKVISNLSECNFGIKVWGPKWKRAALFKAVPKEYVCGPGLWGAEYVSALASFKIGLGLLSKYIPEQHTTRSFEIPAAGTFLLAERTAEHLELFEEGKEAEFFSTREELMDKAKYFLSNDLARKKIAIAGKSRCQRSGYDNDSIIGSILREIKYGHN